MPLSPFVFAQIGPQEVPDQWMLVDLTIICTLNINKKNILPEDPEKH